MMVSVQLVGDLGRRTEESPIRLQVRQGSTVAEVIALLELRSGEVWLAKVGQSLVGRDRRLEEGDLVVLLPPVGGG